MKTRALLLTALIAGGCTTDSDPTGLASPQFSMGAAEPGTPVQTVATVYVEGGISYRNSGPGNNGKGVCARRQDPKTGAWGDGWWQSPGQGKTQASWTHAEHQQCSTASGGYALTVTITDVATYVLARSGNVQLNFGLDPVLGNERRVHYQAHRDATNGAGTLVGADDRGGSWSLDLGQALLNGGSNLMNRAGTVVRVCNAALGCHPGLMSW